jgi:multidrug efflux pump subunit AcrA (membrane-fusion protein)
MVIKMETLKKYRWIVIAIVVATVLGLGAYVFLGRQDQAAAVDSGAETAVAFIGDLAESATANGQVSAAHEAALSLASSGRVNDVPVSVGDAVGMGDVLLQLDTAGLQRSVASAEYDLAIAEAQLADLMADPSQDELAAAEAAVRSAQARLEDLLQGPSVEEIAASEASVKASQANVWSASGSLSATQEVSEADIAAAQKELNAALDDQQAAHDAWVNLAECEENADGTHTCTPKVENDKMDTASEQVRVTNAQVAIKQAQLDELLNPDANQVASSQAGVGSASAQYDAAAARHAALLTGASAADIAAAEADMASAQAALDKLLSGPEKTDITIYETRVAQAQTALQEALNALADATVSAPFDGIVTAVHVAPGEQASGLVAEMIATDGLEIILSVDEIDVGKLAVGQPATITMETWPAVELASEITAIAPRSNAGSSGAVSYDVHLGLPETDLPILVGMTANADLLTANREDVLLVPNAAIHPDRQNGTFSVNVVHTDAEGNTETLPVVVTVGSRDGQFTQIVSGLVEGDEVLLGELSAPVQSFGGPGGGPRG